MSQFQSPDYGSWDVIAEVAPKAKARGMDFFCWDYNNESRRMMQNMPNTAKVAGVDLYGRRMIGLCFNHPDYRAHQIGKIESYPRLPERPDDLRRSVRAAFDVGADGGVLAREYVEMWLANLNAAGDTLREIFAKQG